MNLKTVPNTFIQQELSIDRSNFEIGQLIFEIQKKSRYKKIFWGPFMVIGMTIFYLSWFFEKYFERFWVISMNLMCFYNPFSDFINFPLVFEFFLIFILKVHLTILWLFYRIELLKKMLKFSCGGGPFEHLSFILFWWIFSWVFTFFP